jgi:hypothetical protein
MCRWLARDFDQRSIDSLSDSLTLLEEAVSRISKVDELEDDGQVESLQSFVSSARASIEAVEIDGVNVEVLPNGAADQEVLRTVLEDVDSRCSKAEERVRAAVDARQYLQSSLDEVESALDEVSSELSKSNFDSADRLLTRSRETLEKLYTEISGSRHRQEEIGSVFSALQSRQQQLAADRRTRMDTYEDLTQRLSGIQSDLSVVDELLTAGSISRANQKLKNTLSEMSRLEQDDVRQFESLGAVWHRTQEKIQALETRVDAKIQERFSEFVRGVDQFEELAVEPENSPKSSQLMYRKAERLALEAADFAEQCGMDTTGDLTNRIEKLSTRQKDAHIKAAGQAISKIEANRPTASPPGIGEAESDMNRLLDLMVELDSLDSERVEDIAVIEQEATAKLGVLGLLREEQRAHSAKELSRDGDHVAGRELFEQVSDNLESLLEEEQPRLGTESTREDMDTLLSICTQNAAIVRKVDLGLAKTDDLVDIEYQESAEPSLGGPESSGTGVSRTERTPTAGQAVGPRLGDKFGYEDFEKLDRIGSGGNADVFKASLAVSDSERSIAVKEPRLQGTLQTEVMEQFMGEADTWSKLDDHRNITDVLAYGSAPLPWLAMEYMDRGDMDTVASELDVTQRLQVAISVSDAVWHAHRRGIAHLDLKPQNILFASSTDEEPPVPKVADWGLSKMLLESSSSVQGLSPRYSAPEQFDADTFGSPDNQTDIYQLGLIFYELLTGVHPFEGSTTEIMHGVLDATPAPPSEHAHDLPDGADHVIMKALSRDRSGRYEAAVNLREAFRSLASN